MRLRLQGPLSANGTGRVEVLYHGYWGTICGYFWNERDAKVACRQLGFSPHNAKTLPWNLVPPDSGLIWLWYVSCTGHERSITSCSRKMRCLSAQVKYGYRTFLVPEMRII